MEHTMSPAEYEQVGKRYYKQKQYENAVKAFTNGIEASVRPTISLFDYRAASYDKLEDFNSALKDGREMIRLDQKDIKGYLRVGSVLQKAGKLDKAIGIYKYGMKNVPVNNRDFKVRLIVLFRLGIPS
jgi:F-box/TPR repeat protein Pof3